MIGLQLSNLNGVNENVRNREVKLDIRRWENETIGAALMGKRVGKGKILKLSIMNFDTTFLRGSPHDGSRIYV